MSRRERASSPRRAGPVASPVHDRSFSPAIWIGLAACFVALALAIIWPAIDGEFLSDDFIYIVNNPYVHGLSLENVRTLLDPYGAPTIYTLNYAPVHLLLHAAQWELVGEQTRLYHVTNAVAHGLCCLLLVPFFLRAGIPRVAAVLGALIFLVHPANLETVAWIFQLKTILAVALSIGALLLHERRPGVAAALFTLALLTKVTALGVLPVVALQSWIRSRSEASTPPRWGWIAVWLAIALVISVPEMAAFQRQSDVRILVHEDPLVHLRTIFAIAARYLWMAATGTGMAAFHEPPPAESWLDPWWLAGLVALVVIGVRILQTLVRGDEEACLWMFAAAAFGPVSQVFPFIFPMGDRYLYPILPGLIGALLLAVRPAFARTSARLRPDLLPRAALGLALTVAVVFAARSHARAPVFVDNLSLMQDAALAYPEGMQAYLLRGQRAAGEGDAVAAAGAFRKAIDLGFSDLQALLVNPQLQPILRTPAFRETLRHLATTDIERLAMHEDAEQSELLRLSLAYEVRGELDAAVAAAERAAAADGPFNKEARARLDLLRKERARPAKQDR
jgi:hypothetical protein